jgi:hypothetical protein
MADEIKVDAAKFDRILARMLESKPLSKVEISARIKRERGKQLAAEMREKNKRFKVLRSSANRYTGEPASAGYLSSYGQSAPLLAENILSGGIHFPRSQSTHANRVTTRKTGTK